MGTDSDLKALYIVVNAGFTGEIMDIVRAAGASGGTIVHARGEGSQHRSVLGITLDYEQDIVITIAGKAIAERIMDDVKAKAGWNTGVRGICYMMPVERAVGLRQQKSQET